MSNYEANKSMVWTAVITAVVSIGLTYTVSTWMRIDDTLAEKEIIKMLDEKSVADRAYIDRRIDGVYIYYDNSFKHIEGIIEANDEKFALILESIDDRLDRIDKRIGNK